MKNVFNTSEIAHLWANKLQDSARNSGSNFFFEKNIIYSYGHHFPIAKHVTNENGNSAILFTERRYSNTTAKHISIVRSACSHKDLIFCCNPENSHDANFNFWLHEVHNIAASLPKAKKPEKYLNEISYVSTKVNAYASFFSLPIPVTLQAALSIGSKDEYQQYSEKKAQYEKQELARKKKDADKTHKKELSKWLNYEVNRLYNRNGFDYLRLSGDRIETTQAVKIPYEIGKRLYAAIKENKLNVGDKVLDYEVLSTGKEIKIGCHNFKTSYLIQFGNKIFDKQTA